MIQSIWANNSKSTTVVPLIFFFINGLAKLEIYKVQYIIYAFKLNHSASERSTTARTPAPAPTFSLAAHPAPGIPAGQSRPSPTAADSVGELTLKVRLHDHIDLFPGQRLVDQPGNGQRANPRQIARVHGSS